MSDNIFTLDQAKSEIIDFVIKMKKKYIHSTENELLGKNDLDDIDAMIELGGQFHSIIVDIFELKCPCDCCESNDCECTVF